MHLRAVRKQPPAPQNATNIWRPAPPSTLFTRTKLSQVWHKEQTHGIQTRADSVNLLTKHRVLQSDRASPPALCYVTEHHSKSVFSIAVTDELTLREPQTLSHNIKQVQGASLYPTTVVFHFSHALVGSR